MRITVLAHGTRGDVYPLTALAAELARRGHRVRLAAPPNLVQPASRLGLDTASIAWDTQRALQSPRGQALANAADAASRIRLMHEIGQEHDARLDDEVIDVCADSDAVVSGIVLEWRAALLAKARGIPLIVHDYYPHRMNDVLPHPLMTTDPQPGAAAVRATHRAFARLNSAQLRESVTRFRGRLRDGRLRDCGASRGQPTRPLELQAYSSALVPGLAWDACRPFTADLRMSRPDLDRLGMSAMDTGTRDWLGAGGAPAFFTFGSTYAQDPAGLLAAIGRVCRSVGLRGLVVAGWGLSGVDLPRTPEAELRVVPYLDYDTVLPRCAIAVHHGSATITMAAARAGLPAMVCSSAFDQPFWGTRLERLGAGTHAPYATMTEEVLLSGIRRLMTEPVRRRAALLGDRVRAEPDGTLAAADEIGKYLAAWTGVTPEVSRA